MSELPSDWFGLLAVVYLLGMRHGMDADHLATIDGFTRANQIARPGVAGWSRAGSGSRNSKGRTTTV